MEFGIGLKAPEASEPFGQRGPLGDASSRSSEWIFPFSGFRVGGYTSRLLCTGLLIQGLLVLWISPTLRECSVSFVATILVSR